jgi:uncharacterized protein YbjT (DUF2867 family)
MRIAMTGATGYVGGHVIEQLLRRDHELRALVRSPQRAGWLRERGVAIVAGDLEDQAALRSLMEGADAAIHLVGIILEIGRQTFERIHVAGTRAVVGAAREAGVGRLLHMSALGARPDAGATAYHRTKAAAEQLIRESGISHVVMRPSLIAARGNEALRTVIRMLRFSPVVPVIGSGLYRLQPVAAEDVAEAFAAALDQPGIQGTFEIGGPEALTWHEILDALEAALGVRRRRVTAPVAMVRFSAHAGMVLPELNPITPDQLQMLLEGSTTDSGALAGVFGITPRPFADVAREICAPWAALAVIE